MRDPASSPQGSLGSDVAITEHGEVVRVGASGELDLETAPRLDAALTQVEERARAVTIDLRALTFMDSSAIHLLTRHADRARCDGFALSIIPPAPRVARVLDVAGVTQLLPLVDSASGDAVR
jgi:anti-anti-sigma factor